MKIKKTLGTLIASFPLVFSGCVRFEGFYPTEILEECERVISVKDGGILECETKGEGYIKAIPEIEIVREGLFGIEKYTGN